MAESGADAEEAAKGSAEAEPETESAAATATATAESDESAADGVDIPKQQSAEEAADSDAGEGAHK
ncbi:gliding motility protein [Streptomyces albicerus]|uniref:gliding motility protein n=1 Tax=Streptomyces albicerus TaxID=2569859 RepID=UPI001CEDAF1C|nr:gliding motility protein [Streptomyces albicerus]